jgi:hypothetical protein
MMSAAVVIQVDPYRAVEELSLSEAAQAMGISASALQKRIENNPVYREGYFWKEGSDWRTAHHLIMALQVRLASITAQTMEAKAA